MSRFLMGLFALLLVSGEARADTRVLVDLYPEWQTREGDRPRGGWVLGDFEPPEDETPTYPPDPHPFPECPEGDVYVCPKGQPFPNGCVCLMWPDGRSAKLVDGGGNIEWISPREGRPTLEEFEDYLHATGWFDTEDNTDNDPTPALDDPTEKLIEQIGWRNGSPLQAEGEDPTPSETPTAGQVETTPEPTPPACPPNTTPTVFGLCIGFWTPFGDWREVEHGTPCGQEGEPACPGAPHPQQEPCEPAKEPCASGCCWPIGHTPDGDDGGWDAPLPREVPAGWEGPWRR